MKDLAPRGNPITLNASQRQRLLITCKHVDKLLADIEGTLNAASSKTVFPMYIEDVGVRQRAAIDDQIARVRSQLLRILSGHGIAPEEPHISASHSIEVTLTFIEIAVAELAPRHMRGYGPVSEMGAKVLQDIVACLNGLLQELHHCLAVFSEGEHGSRAKS